MVTFFSNAGKSSNFDTENEVDAAEDVCEYRFAVQLSTLKDLRMQCSAMLLSFEALSGWEHCHGHCWRKLFDDS